MSKSGDSLRLVAAFSAALLLHGVALEAGGRLGGSVFAPSLAVLTVEATDVPRVWTLGQTVSFNVLAELAPGPTDETQRQQQVAVNTYWSQDPYWSDDDVFLHQRVIAFDELQPVTLDLSGQTAQQSGALLPLSGVPGAGAGYVLVVGDPEDVLPVIKTGGHLSATPIYVTPAGGTDLKVRFTEAPASMPAGGYRSVAVEAENLGPGHVTNPSSVGLYLSKDSNWDTHDLRLDHAVLPAPIADRETQGVELTAAVPEAAEGLMHLIAVVDPDLEQNDPDRRNNLDVLPVVIDQHRYPDLVAQELLAPPTLVLGQEAIAEYTVGNEGNSVAVASSGVSDLGWTDKLYLSSDDQLSDDDTLLDEYNRAVPLLAGDRYGNRRARLQTPDTLPEGAAYLILHTDAEAVVDENGALANNVKAVPIQVMSQETAAETLVDLGDPNNEPKKTIAWISLRDFEQLVARRSRLEQPSAQMVADPDPDAPMRIATDNPAQETTPPPPEVAPSPELSEALPQEMREAVSEAARQTTPQVPAEADAAVTEPTQIAEQLPPTQQPETETPLDAVDPGAPKTAEGTQTLAGIDQPAEVNQGPATDASAAAATPVNEPVAERPVAALETSSSPDTTPEVTQEPPANQEVAEATQEETPTPEEPMPDRQIGVDLPTSAPKADLESPPMVRIKEQLALKPGSVVTGKGIRIRTVVPRISYVTYRIKTPARNPVVSITFNREGSVVDAQLVRSSGEDAYDGPVLNSAWRYSAEGQDVENLEGLLQVRIRLLFIEEIVPASESEEE